MNQYCFYVYEHWRPDTGLPFYVGKGMRGRAGSITARNEYHGRVVSKLARLGLSVEVRRIFTYLDEATAHSLEKAQISYWRSRGINLANLTDGGEGTSGYEYTTEQKTTLRTALTKDEIRERRRAAAIDAWNCPEFREKQAAARAISAAKPEVKARRSAATKAAWERQEFRANQVAAQTAAQNRPEVRAKQSAASKVAQNRPDVRAKMSVSIRNAWERPEFRSKIVAAQNSARLRRATSEVRTVI